MILDVDLTSEVPIYQQIRDRIVEAIATGEAAVGSGLPSTRQLAVDLGINFHTVNKAYDLAVSVELQGGQAYDTVVHQYLTQDAVNAYQPGKRFEIKADPDDPSKVMLYGEA